MRHPAPCVCVHRRARYLIIANNSSIHPTQKWVLDVGLVESTIVFVSTTGYQYIVLLGISALYCWASVHRTADIVHCTAGWSRVSGASIKYRCMSADRWLLVEGL